MKCDKISNFVIQKYIDVTYLIFEILNNCFLVFIRDLKGEELRKLIGAPVYIECSSKTQQVSGIFLKERYFNYNTITVNRFNLNYSFQIAECESCLWCGNQGGSPAAKAKEKEEKGTEGLLYIVILA